MGRFFGTGAVNQVSPLVDPGRFFVRKCLAKRGDNRPNTLQLYSIHYRFFVFMSTVEAQNNNRSVTFEDGGEDAAGEFFRLKEKPTSEHQLAPAMADFARATTRDGLEEEQRALLLASYSAKGDFAFLGAPKINKEVMPILKGHASVLKRDDFKVKEQDQVGASLIAIGSAMTELLKPEVKDHLPEGAKNALKQMADGIYLLADHQYRLSIARRAFIVPVLNLVGKNVADDASVDEWLFGSDFAELFKNAQACEKTARELEKPKAPKNPSQPARQQPTRPANPQQQQQQQQQRPQQYQGNAKTPARQTHKAPHHAGGNH